MPKSIHFNGINWWIHCWPSGRPSWRCWPLSGWRTRESKVEEAINIFWSINCSRKQDGFADSYETGVDSTNVSFKKTVNLLSRWALFPLQLFFIEWNDVQSSHISSLKHTPGPLLAAQSRNKSTGTTSMIVDQINFQVTWESRSDQLRYWNVSYSGC